MTAMTNQGTPLLASTARYLPLALGSIKCLATAAQVARRCNCAFTQRFAFAAFSATRSVIACSVWGCGGRWRECVLYSKRSGTAFYGRFHHPERYEAMTIRSW